MTSEVTPPTRSVLKNSHHPNVYQVSFWNRHPHSIPKTIRHPPKPEISLGFVVVSCHGAFLFLQQGRSLAAPAFSFCIARGGKGGAGPDWVTLFATFLAVVGKPSRHQLIALPGQGRGVLIGERGGWRSENALLSWYSARPERKQVA